MGHFLLAFVNCNDKDTDSIIVSGMVAMLALISLSAYADFREPQAFSALNFGTAAAAIIASIGGGRRLRDGIGDATMRSSGDTTTTITPAS